MKTVLSPVGIYVEPLSAGQADAAKMNIVFDYGATGSFVICSKESGVSWSDALQEKIDLTLSEYRLADTFSLSAGGSIEDEFFKISLEFKGNKMLLNVTEKLV